MNNLIVKADMSPSLSQLASPLFICGAAHSGKSELAHLGLDATKPAAILGTSGTTLDEQMAERIATLQSQRPPHWRTYEAIDDLPATAFDLRESYPQILIDSINQFVATALVKRLDQYDRVQIEAQVELELQRLVDMLATPADTRIVIVSSDVGAGVPPGRAAARSFRKLVSQTNRMLATSAASVIDVRYGIPVRLK